MPGNILLLNESCSRGTMPGEGGASGVCQLLMKSNGGGTQWIPLINEIQWRTQWM